MLKTQRMFVGVGQCQVCWRDSKESSLSGWRAGKVEPAERREASRDTSFESAEDRFGLLFILALGWSGSTEQWCCSHVWEWLKWFDHEGTLIYHPKPSLKGNFWWVLCEVMPTGICHQVPHHYLPVLRLQVQAHARWYAELKISGTISLLARTDVLKPNSRLAEG